MAPVASYPPTTMTTSLKQSARAGATTVGVAPPPPKSATRPQQVLDAPVRTAFSFDSMEEALAAFSRGEFLVVSDDESRENEGDLIIAASEVSTEKMAWMIRHTRCANVRHFRGVKQSLTSPSVYSGYICIALPAERLEELEVPMMVAQNEDPHRTAYTVTVDYKYGTSTRHLL